MRRPLSPFSMRWCTFSSLLEVRINSLTPEAPSNVPSSMSVIRLLLRLLHGVGRGGSKKGKKAVRMKREGKNVERTRGGQRQQERNTHGSFSFLCQHVYTLCVLSMTSRQPHVTLCSRYVYNTSDSHLPQLRQLFEDPRCLEHSEFIVVQAPRNREEKRWSETKRENHRGDSDRGGGGRDQGRSEVSTRIHFAVDIYSVTHSSAVYWGM